MIRDAEWVIRRADRLPDGGYQLVCDGVSELVREREAIFLTTLEPDIEVLDPAETRLVPDPSPGFADSRLYLESQLRQAVPNDERIHVAQGAAVDANEQIDATELELSPGNRLEVPNLQPVDHGWYAPGPSRSGRRQARHPLRANIGKCYWMGRDARRSQTS